MALDTGGVTALYRTNEFDPSEPARSDAPTLFDGPDVGAALKAVREFHGVTLQDLADATRIRQTYLAALEGMRVDELPSRPFAVGYVKAYARHLGLDAEAAVERFRQESPDHDEALRAPIGVRKQRDPRLGLILIAGVLILAAFVIWNVAQRAITTEMAPKPAVVAEAAPLPPEAGPAGPSEIGAPLPPPVESTTPDLYETPGLEAATAGDGSADAAEAAAKTRAASEAGQPVLPSRPIGSPFKAQGTVYGAPAGAAVTLQARRSATLEVRGSDGSVYFARVLQAGEAYRVPALKGLSVTGSDPAAFDVYGVGGYKGHLPAATTSLTALEG